MNAAGDSIFERHRVFAIAILMLAVCLITLVVFELGFRLGRDLIKGSPWIARAENVDDAGLGWALNPDKKLVTKINACNEIVVRKTPAGRYLAKHTPASGANAVPVLFLGDSFTQGTETSTDGMYFEVFEKSGNGRYAVSAAGIGGFSTVQEFRLLEKVYPVVQPKLVFWQLSTNDVGENVHTGTDISTVQRPRLYYDLETDRFAIHNPALWLLQHSELFKYLFGEMVKIQRVRPFGLDTLVKWWSPPPQVPAGEINRRGLQVMERMVAKAVQTYPGTKFAGFGADGGFDAEYRAIFERQGAAYLSGLAGQIRAQAAGRPIDCAPLDTHWNHHGNRVAAAVLLDHANRLLSAPVR